MYWPDTGTGVDVEPARKPVASAVRKFFTEGGAGSHPTVPGGDWFNQFTNEMLNVLAAAGIDPSKADDDQLLLAIQAIAQNSSKDGAVQAYEALRRSYAEAGYSLLGTFRLGVTLNTATDVILDELTGIVCSWDGVLPKIVPPNSTPETTGGVIAGAWIPRTDEILRTELSAPDGATKIGHNDSTVSDELERLSHRTIIDAREFGLTTSGVNSTSLLLTAIAQCNTEGAALGFGGMLDFGDAEIIVTDLCDIFGAGGFKNLRFVINQAISDTLKQINGITIATQASGGDHGFVLKKGRHIDFLNIKAKDVEAVLKGETDALSTFHSIGLITVSNMNAISVGRMVDLRHNLADEYAYNDFKFINSRGWFTRYGGFYAEQLDGLQYADNLTHADRNTPSHTNHLYVRDGEWINIGGANTYFEGGREAILIENVGKLSVGGTNMVAFCGQQAPSSGMKINNAGSAKYLNLSLADGCLSVEKSSSHGLEIIATAGSAHIGTISANIDVRSGNAGAGRTYFGATPLTSIPHKGVEITGGIAVYGDAQSKGLLIDSAGVSSRLLDSNLSTAIRSNLARLDDKAATSSNTLTVAVASGVATGIIGPRSYATGDTNTPCAGKITVQAYNAAGTKVGVYELLYQRVSATVAFVKEISSLYDANILVDTPAFGWQTSSSGSLQVFPKLLTAGGGFPNGDFTFVLTSTGNLTFTSR